MQQETTTTINTTSSTLMLTEPNAGTDGTGSVDPIVGWAVGVAVVVGAATWILSQHASAGISRLIKAVAILTALAAFVVKGAGASTGAAVVVFVAAAAIGAVDQLLDRVINPRRAELGG